MDEMYKMIRTIGEVAKAAIHDPKKDGMFCVLTRINEEKELEINAAIMGHHSGIFNGVVSGVASLIHDICKDDQSGEVETALAGKFMRSLMKELDQPAKDRTTGEEASKGDE